MKEIQFEGQKELLEQLDTFVLNYKDEVSVALWQELSKVMNDSKRICPVDTGRLRASGYVFDPVVSFEEISVQLGYATEYAFYVHENLNAGHTYPTCAKFLEWPLDMASRNILQNIVDRISRLLGKYKRYATSA